MATKGSCVYCGKAYSPGRAKVHLLACMSEALSSSRSTTEGLLIRVSWVEAPSLYWMLITLPKSASLTMLDQFLRRTWLECCDHMSEFIIYGESYLSTEPQNSRESMACKVDKVLAPGVNFKYIYDMGSSTELQLQVLDKVVACPQKEVKVLMKNDPPDFPCSSCSKPADIICSFCGHRLCTDCSEKHPCAVNEDDTYMLMPLVNSPRAGVCAYGA